MVVIRNINIVVFYRDNFTTSEAEKKISNRYLPTNTTINNNKSIKYSGFGLQARTRGKGWQAGNFARAPCFVGSRKTTLI